MHGGRRVSCIDAHDHEANQAVRAAGRPRCAPRRIDCESSRHACQPRQRDRSCTGTLLRRRLSGQASINFKNWGWQQMRVQAGIRHAKGFVVEIDLMVAVNLDGRTTRPMLTIAASACLLDDFVPHGSVVSQLTSGFAYACRLCGHDASRAALDVIEIRGNAPGEMVGEESLLAHLVVLAALAAFNANRTQARVDELSVEWTSYVRRIASHVAEPHREDTPSSMQS